VSRSAKIPVAFPDGPEVVRAAPKGPAADSIHRGRRIGADRHRKGAQRILAQVYAP